MTVVSTQIYYPSTITPVTGVLVPQTISAFNLEKVLWWNDWTTVGSTATIQMAYDPSGQARMIWPKAQFEAAMAAYLATL